MQYDMWKLHSVQLCSSVIMFAEKEMRRKEERKEKKGEGERKEKRKERGLFNVCYTHAPISPPRLRAAYHTCPSPIRMYNLKV